MKKLSINDFRNKAEAITSKKLLHQISGGEDGGITAEDDWETPVV